MWDTDKFNNFVSALEENDAMRVATWLSQIADDPSHNPEIIPHLEALLKDTRITMLSTPVAYGEIRWNAALALVMERQVQQIGAPTETLANTFSPMGIPQILFLLSDSDFTLPGGDDWIKKLRGIRDAGNLPLADYEISFGQEPKKL
ncbi:MAG: hypothetical protein Phog2KO_19490 [Phototrophicaceae bacterium]